jgi:disulfide bond formation protein DsbB
MYPIFLMSFFSSLKKDFNINFYNFILAFSGFLIAGYHYIISTFNISDSLTCNISSSCLVEYFKEFGFVTLPLMSMVSFICIILLSSFYFLKNIDLN